MAKITHYMVYLYQEHIEKGASNSAFDQSPYPSKPYLVEGVVNAARHVGSMCKRATRYIRVLYCVALSGCCNCMNYLPYNVVTALLRTSVICLWSNTVPAYWKVDTPSLHALLPILNHTHTPLTSSES